MPNPDEDTGTLADDLQYSSEDMEDNEEEDDDDDDWEQVEEDEGLTVTIDHPPLIETQPSTETNPGMVVEEGQVVDIGNLAYYQEASGPISFDLGVAGVQASEEAEEQVVDENYDPTDFFSSIGKGQQQPAQSEEENAGPAGETSQGQVDVINDDLNISDSDDDDEVDDKTVVAPPAPPLVPEPPPPDEDGLWF